MLSFLIGLLKNKNRICSKPVAYLKALDLTSKCKNRSYTEL